MNKKAFGLCVATMVCVIIMVIAWHMGWRDLRKALIYLCSTAYLVVALLSGAHKTWFGRLVFAGVLCCWIGDIVGPKNFLAGAMAFLIGHLFFVPAFIVRGVRRNELLAGIAIYILVSGTAMAVIGPKVPPDERLIIYAYTGVIGIMGAVSVGVWSTDRWLTIGAAVFYVSDLFLAQTAFLDGGFINTALGYPLYYLAVLIMAYTPNRMLQIAASSPGEAAAQEPEQE